MTTIINQYFNNGTTSERIEIPTAASEPQNATVSLNDSGNIRRADVDHRTADSQDVACQQPHAGESDFTNPEEPLDSTGDVAALDLDTGPGASTVQIDDSSPVPTSWLVGQAAATKLRSKLLISRPMELRRILPLSVRPASDPSLKSEMKGAIDEPSLVESNCSSEQMLSFSRSVEKLRRMDEECRAYVASQGAATLSVEVASPLKRRMSALDDYEAFDAYLNALSSEVYTNAFFGFERLVEIGTWAGVVVNRARIGQSDTERIRFHQPLQTRPGNVPAVGWTSASLPTDVFENSDWKASHSFEFKFDIHDNKKHDQKHPQGLPPAVCEIAQKFPASWLSGLRCLTGILELEEYSWSDNFGHTNVCQRFPVQLEPMSVLMYGNFFVLTCWNPESSLSASPDESVTEAVCPSAETEINATGSRFSFMKGLLSRFRSIGQ